MVSSCLESLAFSVCIRYEPRYTVLEALKQYIRRITCPSLRDIEFWDITLQAGVADIDQVFSINFEVFRPHVNVTLLDCLRLCSLPFGEA